MIRIATGALLAGVFALAGCAAPEPAPMPAGAPQLASAAPAEQDATMTGSRLKRKSTDRLLRTVGPQDARNTIDSSPNPLKSGE